MSTFRLSPIAAIAGAALACLSACGSNDGNASVPAPASTDAQPSPSAPTGVVPLIAAAAKPISGGTDDYADILAAAATARRILLGESSHGTSDYYRERGRLTERLIAEHGVNAVTIEGDWSPTFRVNLYVRGLGSDLSATEALSGYTARFPRWMWRNVEFRDFVERLRTRNLALPPAQRVGIYGMDVYDLYDAADQVVAYLEGRDPAAAARVRQLYACFGPYERTPEAYGEAMATRSDTCRDEAEAAVAEVARLPRPGDVEQAENHFGAKRASASVASAEAYYRVSYGRTAESSWNLRDRRMADTLEAVATHAEAQSATPGKTVSWSHNTHSGNAAATSAALSGELNLGQLMRERHGDAALLVGFFSYSGTVFAAPRWGDEGRVYTMRPALEASHSGLFHQTELPSFSLLLRGNQALEPALRTSMLQRAIGVVYLPDTERQSHYIQARLPEQFDAAIFFDQSNAVTPL